MRNAHLVGTFEALGGTGNDVRVMGVTPKQFLEWRNGQLHCKGSVARCMLRSTSAVGCKIHRWRTLDRWTFRYRSPARIMLSLTTPFLSSLPRTSPRRSALPTSRRVFDSLGRRPTTKRGGRWNMKNLAALAAILPTSVCRVPGASVAPGCSPSPTFTARLLRPTRVQRGRSDHLAPPRIADDGTAELGSTLFAPPNH